MAKDAGTKIDQPSDQEGKGTPAKDELQTQEAAQAAGKQKAAEKADAPKPKKPRKPAAKKAEGTAAAKTKVDKKAAEAAVSEGSSEPAAKPKKKPAAKKAAAKKDAAKPASAKKAAAEKDDAKPAGAGKAAAKKDDAKPAGAGKAAAKKDDAKPAGAGKPAAKKDEKADGKPVAATRPSRRARGDQAERVTVRAHAKYVRTSARKARLIADHVRGKDVAQARALLAFSPRSVAEDWRKLLESAIANAEHNHDLVGDNLRVLNATADEGPTLKRFRPRAMGRATRIRKRTSHLTITLTPKETR